MNFKVVILSAGASNLMPCVRNVMENEPDLPAEDILIVDDGARQEAAPQLPSLTWLAGVKPFVFARNANLGLQAAACDAILLNDDARLLTRHGFTGLVELLRQHPEIGICSAGIQGVVGNPRQRPVHPGRLCLENDPLAFVCVCIPHAAYERIGPLDERFTAYGYEDNDYCIRVQQAGLRLGIWHGCVVDHSGHLPSTYRSQRDVQSLLQKNRNLFEQKWRQGMNKAHPVAPPRPAPVPIPPTVSGPRFNLSCCDSVLRDYSNYTILPTQGAETMDFKQPWPWKDGSVGEIRAWDFVEHLPDKTFTMNELWRVLAPGGQVEIAVPTTDGTGAFQDPTHASFWNRRSFLYYQAGTPQREANALRYGIQACFRVLCEQLVPTVDGPRLAILLEAVRPEVTLAGTRKPDGAVREAAATGRVDLLYLAWNRLAFTQETFSALLANTDWELIHELFVYDDGSTDGTREWLESKLPRVSVPVRFQRTSFGSPVDVMLHFISAASAPILAKTDSDAMYPSGWLRQSLEVLDRHPELSLLGIEAMNPVSEDSHVPREYTPSQFISGLGLYRRSAFAGRLPTSYKKYFGFEEWQMAQPALMRGWINPSVPVFLLDRLPFDPWASLSDEYVRRGWQRSWPKYERNCTLWHWRWPPSASGTQVSSMAGPAGDERFVAALRIKDEAAHIHEVIEHALGLCRSVFIFDDHSADDTVAICRAFGERVTVFLTPFAGLDEARDKNFLLQKVIASGAEWVLWIDGDEVLEHNGPEKLIRAVNDQPAAAAFCLKIAYLWDDSQHVRVDGIWGRFKRPSLFRLRGQLVQQLVFPATGFGGNLHCGNVPQGLNGPSIDLDVRLKHYGYMDPARRMAKYDWYRAVDPGNRLEDEYRHLAGIPGARHAPGPAKLLPWSE